MNMPNLQPNPFDGFDPDHAVHFAGEMTFKEIELRSTDITLRHGHDHAEHSHIDVAGGDIEITGRRLYVAEAEVVFTGANWVSRLANAMFVHDTTADEAGELTIPDGPIFDAKWVDAEERWSGKNGKIVRCTWKEHSHADTHVVDAPPPRALMRSSVPEEDGEVLLPLVDDYEAVIDSGGNEAVATLLEMLVRLDNAAYLAQRAIDTTTLAGCDRFAALMAVRANARRAFPAVPGVDLAAVLR
jgi:hypothetical protein